MGKTYSILGKIKKFLVDRFIDEIRKQNKKNEFTKSGKTKFRNLIVKRNFWLKEILLEKSFHNITVYDEIEQHFILFRKNVL